MQATSAATPAPEKEANQNAPTDLEQKFSEELATVEAEIEPVLMLTPANAAEPLRHDTLSRILKRTGIVLTAFWFGFCLYATYLNLGPAGLSGLRPQEIGGLLAGIMAPVVLYWLVIAYMQRDADVQIYARALRQELQSLLFPAENQDTHVNKNIEQLVEQAAQLAHASKTSLDAIYRARTGLHEELREFTTLTHKAEHHIGRMSKNITGRIDKTQGLITDIEKRTTQLNDTGLDGIGDWEKAVARLFERVGEIENALKLGTTHILNAAEQAEESSENIRGKLEGSTDSLTEGVRSVAERLREVTGEFETHSQSLEDASDRAGEQARHLGALIDGQITAFETITDRAVETFGQSTEAVDEARSNLDETITAMSEKTQDMTGAVDVNIERLEETTQRLGQKTEELESRLERQTLSLDEAIARFASYEEKLENAGTGTIRALGEASALAMDGAAAVRNAMNQGVDSLKTAAQLADDNATRIANALMGQTEDLQSTTLETAERLDQILEQFALNKTRIDELSDDASGQVTKLSEAIDNQNEKLKLSAFDVASRVEQIRKAFEEPLRAIAKAAGEAGDRSDDINAALSCRIEELTAAAEKAAGQSEHIRDTLRGQAQEISQLSGEIAGNARAINKQFDEHRDNVVQALSETTQHAETTKQSLSDEITLLRTTATDAQESVASVSGLIARQTEELSAGVKVSEDSLGRLDKQLSEQRTTLAAIAEKSTHDITRVITTLAERAQSAEEACQTTLTRAAEAETRLQALHSSYESTTDANFGRIEQLGGLFDERLTALKTGAQAIASELRNVSETLHVRLQDIEGVAQNASEKIETVGQALDSQASDIHLSADQAALKIEGVQKALNDQFHELSEVAGRALAQIREAQTEFSRCTEQVDTSTDHVTQRLSSAGDNARSEAQQLAKIAETTAHLTDTVSGKLSKGAQSLFDQANTALEKLETARDDLVNRAKDMTDELQHLISTSHAGSKSLRDETLTLTTVSEDSADEIRKATDALAQQIETVSKTTDDIAKRIETVSSTLSSQSNRLLSTGENTVRNADEAAASFARQSSGLIKASREAMDQAQNIQKTESRVQRDTFLSASKFVVESLHSLAVDFTRILEPEIPEKAWKAYQKGDLSAFTRRLVQMRETDNLPVDRIRQKYADDSEFRTYVQRYLRMFEENYDQAMGLDHGNLLASTFMSADTGKLYQFLCSVIDRSQRELPENLKDAA